MSSSEQQIVNVVATGRFSNKLTLDSQQQQKREQQQQKYLEQIQRKKQQKRQKRQQAEKLQRQKLKMQQEKQKIYQQPQKMFQQDSDDGIQYKRVVKKIKKMYPQLMNKYDNYGNKKKNDFIVNDENDEDQSSDSDQSQSNQSQSSRKVQKKKKIQKKQKKVQKRPERPERQEKKVVQTTFKKQKIKIQPKTISDKKQNLVQQLSIRWWYALPEWPPANLDYTQKLKQLGYRLVNSNQFSSQSDIVNGLQKVMAVDGYKGVFKSKTKLIDVRPKQTAPTLNNFRNMSSQELNNLLRKALQGQIQQLERLKYQQQGQKELLTQLKRQLVSLK